MKNNQIVFTLLQEGLQLQLDSAGFAPEEIESLTYDGRRAILTLTHDVTDVPAFVVANLYDVESVALPASTERVHSAAFSSSVCVIRYAGPLATADGRFLIKDGTLIAYVDNNYHEIVLPDTVTALADGVFRSSYALQTIILPAHLRHIGDDVFNTCTQLREVVWPETLQTIGQRAFMCCALEHLVLPDSVTIVGEEAFAYCEQLEHVRLGASVEHIGPNAFGGCRVNESFSGRHATADGKLVILNHTVVAAVSFAEELTVPEGVERIAPYAFYHSSVGEKVRLPASLKEIGHHAFFCSHVDVELPDGLQTIGEMAFRDDFGLTHVRMPESVSEIGDGAYGGCAAQQYSGRYATADGLYLIKDGCLLGVAERDTDCYEVPQGVTRIGAYAFANLDVKARLVLPEGLVEIGDHALDGDEGAIWTSLSLPSTLRTIGRYAFNYLQLTGTLRLPEGLEHIGDHAFEDAMLGDPHVVLPSTLRSIGYEAFYDVNYLSDEKPVYELRGENPPVFTEGPAFYDFAALRIPEQARARYEADAEWAELLHRTPDTERD